MCVIVLDENKVERETLVRQLQQGQIAVHAAADVHAATALVQSEPAEVILVSWPHAGGAELVRKLRAFDATQHTYVIALVEKNASAEIAALYAAGADDFMRRPVTREELLGRVGAPQRIRAWLNGATLVRDWSTSLDVRRLRACRDMGRVVAQDLEQMFGRMDVTEGWPSEMRGELRGATIPMSLPSEASEIRVSIVMTRAALKVLGLAMLGNEDADDAALEDLLRELANTAGGAVKRAALEEQVPLTTGLPASRAPSVIAPGEMTRCWIARLVDCDATVGVVGEVRKLENQRIAAAALREGMVVARDLKNEAGALIVPAGTRLTSNAAERVARLLGERFVVEVACAA